MRPIYLLLAVMASPITGLSQTMPAATPPPPAAVPQDRPTQAPPYQPIPAGTGASGLVQALGDWPAANATVARYPGHSAIVRWERTR